MASGEGARAAELLEQRVAADGTISYSGSKNIDAVLFGSKWSSTNLTFSFPDSVDVYGSGYDFGQPDTAMSFTDLQKAAAREAFSLVAGYTNLTFTEVAPNSAGADRPTFRLAQTDNYFVQSAMGYFPGTVGGVAGDIWFGTTEQPYYLDPIKGSWGYTTTLHEIGHTLGLKHGMDDYTNLDLSGYFDTDEPFYGTQALDYRMDGQAWSLMTYSTAPDIELAFNGDYIDNAQSFMMFDIAALQFLYGANYTTNAGNTVYRWDAVTGEGFINNVGQGAPAGNKILETIWDGGGIDTYDLSNYAGGVKVDLRPGSFSTFSRRTDPQCARLHRRLRADDRQRCQCIAVRR